MIFKFLEVQKKFLDNKNLKNKKKTIPEFQESQCESE